jgi:hypothetical protein
MKNLYSSMKPVFNRMKSKTSSMIFVPGIIGSHVGAAYMGYTWFMDSRQQSFENNVLNTTFGIFGGCFMGFIPVRKLVEI